MPSDAPLDVFVIAATPSDEPAARAWAARLRLPLARRARATRGRRAAQARRAVLALVVGGEVLGLGAGHVTEPSAGEALPPLALEGAPLAVDFVRDADRRAQGAGRQPLARALGRRRATDALLVIDATAGWGRDAALCAALGAQVVACERHPLLVALLEDGLLRAARHAPALAARLRVVAGPAQEVLAAVEADVALIDPMFARAGGDARARKPLQLLQALLGPGDEDEAAALLAIARAHVRRRVLVKRARHAPPLGGVPPTASQAGRSLRWDVYLPP